MVNINILLIIESMIPFGNRNDNTFSKAFPTSHLFLLLQWFVSVLFL